MVDENARGGSGKAFDWPAIHAGWRRGETPEALSERYGAAPYTVKSRCGWIDLVFPPGSPRRLALTLTAELAAAQSALDHGDAAGAERRAKALLALIRAARALEEWSMDERTAVAAGPQTPPREQKDRRPELERRLAGVARSLGLEADGAGDDAGAERGVSGPLDELGEAGADPA